MIETAPTFRFRRYREEVALRSSRQKSKDGTEDGSNLPAATSVEHGAPKNSDITTRPRLTTVTQGDSCDDNGGNVVQNLSSAIVVIDLHGNVLTEKKNIGAKIIKTNDQSDDNIGANNNGGGKSNEKEGILVVPKGSTLLLRNLKDCHVTIHLALPAVHFVGIEDTQIIFYNRTKNGSKTHDGKSIEDSTIAPVSVNEVQNNTNANTTIHMTDCRGKSSLQLETSAQQLRIHKSVGLRVEMMRLEKNRHPDTTSTNMEPFCDWKPGSIILEVSKAIIFCVLPLAEATTSNQSQRERQLLVSSSTVTASTKKYWYQAIVKDFQWLRKGIISPNFQVEVLKASHENRDKKHCTEDLSNTPESTRNISPHRSAETNESECSNSSDSDDEL